VDRVPAGGQEHVRPGHDIPRRRKQAPQKVGLIPKEWDFSGCPTVRLRFLRADTMPFLLAFSTYYYESGDPCQDFRVQVINDMRHQLGASADRRVLSQPCGWTGTGTKVAWKNGHQNC
jgi:hypothetical protein